MHLFPAIDLRNGQVVRLTQGDYDRQTTYQADPVDQDKQFRDAGSEGTLAVPWVSVGEDRDGRFVFVLEPESKGVGTVHRRAVAIGAIGQRIEILEGLEAGDLVVTAGTRRLADGMQVKLEEMSGGGE